MSGMKTRQQSNRKNCSPLERSGKHESTRESVIPEWAQYKGLPNGRGLSNGRGLPSGRSLSNGCGRSRSMGNDSLRNDNDESQDANPLEEIAASLTKNVAQIQDDLYEQDGFHDRLSCLAQTYVENADDLESLRKENAQLREEVQLLKSIVISLDRKVSQNQNDIVDLKSRSMKYNLMIHNLAEEDGENLFVKIPKLIKEHFGINTEFSIIHRNGWNKQDKTRQDKPRSITGKLINFSDKEKILSAQRERKDRTPKLPFFITPQQPIQITENRKKLIEVSNKYKEDNVRTRILGNKLVFQNGTVYRDKVMKPRAEDILLIDDDEKQKTESLEVVSSDPVTEAGNKFTATAAAVNTYANIRAFYKKVVSVPDCARADHNILGYRFRDKSGLIHEDYQDDGEYGAGRKILGALRDNNIENAAVVVTRLFAKHVGLRRFSIMENVAIDALRKLSD